MLRVVVLQRVHAIVEDFEDFSHIFRDDGDRNEAKIWAVQAVQARA